MKAFQRQIAICVLGLSLPVSSLGASPAPQQRMVTTEPGVQLEVLDWGGSGPPLIFLAGFGGTAHTFDGFAQKFTDRHHVYSITRRGFGASSRPAPTESAYRPERLAADIIAVIDQLKLRKPFIAGHSVAGQELSEIGTQYSGKASGLIYLDAANSQAFYGAHSSVLYPIAGEVRRDLERLIGAQPSEARALILKLKTEVPRLERGLEWYAAAVADEPDRPVSIQNSPEKAVQTALVRGAKIYGPVKVPTLSIVALPAQCEPECNTDAEIARQKDNAAQAADFQAANQQAAVIRIPNADHFLWLSNGSEVKREMDRFMDRIASSE
jgi:non-heme chloroperoxidase